MWRFAPRFRYFSLVAAALLFCPVVTIQAQSQTEPSDSVAEAARKAREKKKEAAKTQKVWTNDNLNAPPASAQSSSAKGASAGEQTTPRELNEGPAPSSTEGTVAPPAEKPRETAKQQAELNEAKRQLADAQKDLDLAQRDFDLQREQFYTNPDFQSDKKGRAHLDDLQGQIADKKQEVDRLKERVASLEAKLK
ncbi:MAG: hypothetical protein ABSF92_14035 [Candidatus Acidiferrales bacterium]|jgi:hypothetical protein